jgi:hypothetical protein
MTMSDDIQRKIAHLEGQRALLGDAAIDAAIAALRAQQPPAGAITGEARAGRATGVAGGRAAADFLTS